MGQGLQKKEKDMKCVICRHGETEEGRSTVTLERDGATIVFKEVPARICSNCGEVYLEEPIVTELWEEAARIVRNGVEVDIRKFRLDAA
jgi:YgiT-type zinc finger domain-containing protein